MTRLSFTTSVCHVTSLSIIPPETTVCPLPRPHVTQSVHHTDMFVCHTTHQSVCQSTHKSVALSVCTMVSPSIIPVCPSYTQSIHHPINSSMTRQSITHLSVPRYIRQAVLLHLTIHPTYTPVCQTIHQCLTICMTTHSVRQHVHHCPTV